MLTRGSNLKKQRWRNLTHSNWDDIVEGRGFERKGVKVQVQVLGNLHVTV